MRPGLPRETVLAIRAGLPVAVLLAALLGLAVAVGANLSNATPSAAQPFGWPGAANFEGGVASVRPELLLAASLPALLLGLRSVPPPTRAPAHSIQGPLAGILAGAALIAGAVLAATLVGALAAAASPAEAYFAFWVAHSLLALAFFALGFLARAAVPRHAALVGLSAWAGYAVLLENTVRWQLFRQQGYDQLAAGNLPGWFYVLQVLSPIAAYRAILIVWQPGFRDYVEHAALDGATLPGWLTAPLVSTVMFLLWVVLPLGIAVLVLHLRSRRAGTGTSAGPLMPVVPAVAAAGIATAGLAAAPRAVVRVQPERPERPDRPAPIGGERRPRLNAETRSETLRASFRPSGRSRRPR